MIRSIITAPELMFVPEVLPLRMAEMAVKGGRAAQMAARIGTEATQIGALAGAEAALKQRVETGEVNPAQVAADTIMVAARLLPSSRVWQQ